MDSRGQVFCLGKSECLRQPDQMELSKYSWFPSEIIDCKKGGYLNA